MKLRGSYCALTTPFRPSGDAVDWTRLEEHIEFQIAHGTAGIVVCGTTGESPTVTHDEHDDIMRRSVEIARRRIPVIAGTGSNSTAEALRLSIMAKEVGCDGLLVVTPYYNKPSQEGLYRHFETIADTVDLPIILYNIPGRTGVTLQPETIARLARHPHIAAVKEATGTVQFTTRLRQICPITILSGDDALTLPLMALGATGVVSVVANVMPREIQALCDLANSGDFVGARAVHDRLMPLMDALFVETNPVPVKAALERLKRASGIVRPPLCPLTPESLKAVDAALKAVGLI